MSGGAKLGTIGMQCGIKLQAMMVCSSLGVEQAFVVQLWSVVQVPCVNLSMPPSFSSICWRMFLYTFHRYCTAEDALRC